MLTQEPRCLKCGKPKEKAKHASITQWMSSCNCDLILEDQATEIIACQTCGKRIEHGRAGSFTQWVFRSDLCSCDKPKPERAAQRRSAAPFDVKSVPKAEVEIEVDSKDFPLDRYKPLRHLGDGASGAVYLCRDRLLNSKVAVKMLRVLNAEQLISFQQEARATSKLNHPNIVRVLNFGASESGAPYMVMDCFPGCSLESCLLENGPLPGDVALHIFATLCDALETAHRQGIFHRDIKSSNILIGGFDSRLPDVRLIDFGVALVKHVHQESTMVQGITVVGTPAYMSPDQALGLPYDERSEVYALGCALFEALTGRPPFVCETALETINMHASEEPPWLAEVNPDIEYSEALELLVARCLAKDPDDRFQSMHELKIACQGAVTSESGSIKETSTFGRYAADQPAGAAVKVNAATILVFVCAMILIGLVMTPIVTLLFDTPVQRKPTRLFQSKMSPELGSQSVDAPAIYSERDFSLLLLDGTDKSLNEVPELALVKNLKLSSGSISRAALHKFASRPNVRLTDLRLSGLDDCDEALSAICSAPNTKLRSMTAQRCDSVSMTGVEALVKQPLESIYLSGLTFEGDSLEFFLRNLSKTKVKSVALNGVGPRLSDTAAKYLCSLQQLMMLSITSYDVPSSVFEHLGNLRRLEGLLLDAVVEIKPESFAHLQQVRDLKTLTIGKTILSPGQLGLFLQKHRVEILSLTDRENLIGDLKSAGLARVRSLTIRRSSITPETVNLIKQLKNLKSLDVEFPGDPDNPDTKKMIETLRSSVPYFSYSRGLKRKALRINN